jgi:hypothetical protein
MLLKVMQWVFVTPSSLSTTSIDVWPFGTAARGSLADHLEQTRLDLGDFFHRRLPPTAPQHFL